MANLLTHVAGIGAALKILIVYNSALDPVSFSGVQRYFADVVEVWTGLGHTVDFWVARGAWPVFAKHFPNSRLISSDNVFKFAPEQLAQTWRFLPAFAWRMITPYFARLPERYDVVLACAQFPYEVGPTMRLARISGAAKAARIHHVVGLQRVPRNMFDRLHIYAERVTATWLNRHFELLLCTSKQVARDYHALEARLGLAPSELHCTGNGVRLAAIPFAPGGPKCFDAIVLGRLHEHKGVFDLPEVWRLVRKSKPEARLAVVGEGPHRTELVARLTAAGVGPDSGAVTIFGAVDDAEKNRILADSSIGLSLSREEGWGLSITEFLGAGLPVVAMELPVFAEVFPGQLDLTPAGDPSAMAARIVYWLSHPGEAAAGAAGRRRFLERYDYRNVAVRELELLARAVESRRPGNPGPGRCDAASA